MYRFSRFLRRWVPCLIVPAMLGNVVISIMSLRSITPRVVHHVQHHVTTNYLYSVVTDRVEVTSSPSSFYSDVKSDVKSEDVLADYDYMIVDGRKMVRMYGRYYGVGSICSHGRIMSIWPDRIVTSDCVVLNRKFSDVNAKK